MAGFLPFEVPIRVTVCTETANRKSTYGTPGSIVVVDLASRV